MPRHSVPFWDRVDRSGNCWLWTGHRNVDGYGTVRISGRMQKAHRVAWQMAHGPISPNLHVLHRCDNPPCVNPAHLFLGTNHDNVIDRHTKGRSKNLDRGERHPKAKLTSALVAEMRSLRTAGWTQIRLAQYFGVSRGNVSKIVTGGSY